MPVVTMVDAFACACAFATRTAILQRAVCGRLWSLPVGPLAHATGLLALALSQAGAAQELP